MRAGILPSAADGHGNLCGPCPWLSQEVPELQLMWVSSETIKTAAGEKIFYWNVCFSNSTCLAPHPHPLPYCADVEFRVEASWVLGV